MKRIFVVLFVLMVCCCLRAQGQEPIGWYAGDMHVHRSCGATPVSLSTIYEKMNAENLAAVSLLADMGNGEVQDPTTDLARVTGQDDPVSTSGRVVHWDAEWHWDATYSQYSHQALGGHILALGLREAHQIWDESTHSIFQWAHAQNGIAGFAHMQYLDNAIPQSLTCCTPIEYPVEVALGAADFISEDVSGSDSAIQAYYRLLNSGFRPGFAAGTDYPCNDGSVGSPLTYVRVANGEMTYRNWIDGIASGRTVVSRNGHNEFLDLKVNDSVGPGDEVHLTGGGNVLVSVQWSATQNLSGTIELLWNGVVVVTKQATVSSGSPSTLSTTLSVPKSGWLAARRMGTTGHIVHTAAVFVKVDNAPVRANASDPQFYVQWMDNLLTQTSPGGAWNRYFPTALSATQARYQAAKALYQQIALEAEGTAPTLNSIAVSPASQAIASGATRQFTATGIYSNGSSLDITAQAAWTSSSSNIASIGVRGLAQAATPGTTSISATLGSSTATATLIVQPTALEITTQALPTGAINTNYSATLAASGGLAPYTWSLGTGSSPPSGLSLSATGQITGAPIAAGTTSTSFSVSDSAGTRVSKTLSITINAAVQPTTFSIWTPSTVPGIVDAGPDSPVELGIRFKADQDGSIVGIRFHKSAANTGTHTGTLWTSTGTKLGSVLFTAETASGWQQADFPSPIEIKAGQTYVASYHTDTAHYSDDQHYFTSKGVDNAPLHASQDGTDSPNGVFAYGSSSIFPNQSWNASNYWVDVAFALAGPDTTPPSVVSVSPASGASGVVTDPTVTVAFQEAMDPATTNSSTVYLIDSSSTTVPGTLQYNSGSFTATLTPSSQLLNSTIYTAVVKGGTADPRAKDVAGNALASDYTWSFSTAAAPPPPPNEGPGGPILVVSSSSRPFSRYYAEILRAEGLNEFTAMDISLVTADTLTGYDLVVLSDLPLTASQADMFTTWVSAGGNLIAMHPDSRLADLLGVIDTGATLADSYLVLNTTSGPGAGLVGQSMQFHGTATRYVLNGATTLATLYSNASTPTSNPAVTITPVGLGQAAAFSFDLAKSIVYTRQGNPAWSGQARDGQSGPIRPDDLFYGNASFDPQPDWVNLSKVAIPQADEQQRLLANLILQMNQRRKPLPRFWYFPKGYKAAVVMTGDDHGAMYGGAGATADRFNKFLAASPTGCSVQDWTCVRSTAYIVSPAIAGNALTPTQAQSYVAQGFEVGVHLDSIPSCSNWTPSELEATYANQVGAFTKQYASIPAPKTHRMHCVSWSDYDSQPKTALRHGIRLDTTYYYWPPQWVNDTPGLFTGSGMPMRFADRDGNLLDVYQATTQLTDESGHTYPYHIDTLLDNALGAAGYFGFFTANIHNDSTYAPGADAIVASAQSRGVPVISAAQLLAWLDGRNGSSFGSLAWSGNTLTFTIAVGAGANGLQAMLPANAATGGLTAIALDGVPVAFTLKTIKGITYAVFSAAPGSYEANYSGIPQVTLTALSLNQSTVPSGTSSTGTITLSGTAPTGGAAVALATSDSNATTLPQSTVVVPEGATTATFVVSTNSVSSTTNVTISASYNGNTVSSGLAITPVPTIASMALNPANVAGSTSSTGTVTLNIAASGGGMLVTLASSDSTVASVPTSVIVPAGSTTATFTVTTSPVASQTSVVITAASGNISKTATLTVTAPALSSVAMSPTLVYGGISSTGTVTLSAPAPADGVVLALASSNSTAAKVPATVTVPAGSATATFAVTTYPIAASTTSAISATYSTVTRSATLTIRAPALNTLALNPTTVKGGASSTGTVTLSSPAPSGGALVTLSSSNTYAVVPATVLVSAGSTSATFTITTRAVTTRRTPTIYARFSGVRRFATLTITP